MNVKEEVKKIIMSTKVCKGNATVSEMVMGNMASCRLEITFIREQLYNAAIGIGKIKNELQEAQEEKKAIAKKLKRNKKILEQLERYYEKHREREEGLNAEVFENNICVDGQHVLAESGVNLKAYRVNDLVNYLGEDHIVKRVVVENGKRYVYCK